MSSSSSSDDEESISPEMALVEAAKKKYRDDDSDSSSDDAPDSLAHLPPAKVARSKYPVEEEDSVDTETDEEQDDDSGKKKGGDAKKRPGSKVMDEVSVPVTPTKKAKVATTTPKKNTILSVSPVKRKGKPTYTEMVHEALVSLGDRSGSSGIAISKWLMAHHDHLTKLTPGKFKHSMSLALKTCVKSGRFVKVKASYKVNPEWVKKERQATRAKEAMRKAKERKRQVELQKIRDKKNKLSEEDRKKQAKLKAEEAARQKKERAAEEEKKRVLNMTDEEKAVLAEKKRKEVEAEQKKAEEVARKKVIAERIRKRRFPMEDSKLMAEDKELGVRPPAHVTKRPTLPYGLLMTVPFDKRDRRVPTATVNASTASNLSWGNRGLVSDMIQVYQFFHGDVGCASNHTFSIPEFSMKHLCHAVDEIVSGNAKSSKLVPPLIAQLFVASLTILTDKDVEGNPHLANHEKKMLSDLAKLGSALSPVSWPEIVRHYMDVMDRFYTSTLSLDTNVLPGGTIDMTYSEETSDHVVLDVNHDEEERLPEGYYGYIGDPRSVLAKAHAKLTKMDPWQLNAEEIMALLRALTDDILGTLPEIGTEIEARGEELYELLKVKRVADSAYRKVKFAHEGPKQPPKPKKEESKDEEEQKDKEESKDGGKENSTPQTDDSAKEATKSNEPEKEVKKENEPKKEWKQTATKKEFENAERAKAKAHDAYEKGLRKLVSRGEPLGFDRNHNAMYYFIHDPEVIYVEVSKTTSGGSDDIVDLVRTSDRTWHVIEKKSLFDSFITSLDVRGTRERDLYETLVEGPVAIRRNLFDDIKERNAIVSRKREQEELERRLENAKIACAAEAESGRRSGRLASLAQVDLARVEEEIQIASALLEADSSPAPLNYRTLTGLDALAKFDAKNPSLIAGSQLLQTEKVPGSGVIGSLVFSMLDLENLCTELVPWEDEKINREAWTSNLKDVVDAWNRISPLSLGPASEDNANNSVGKSRTEDDASVNEDGDVDMDMDGDGKRRKSNSDGTNDTIVGLAKPSVTQILSWLKQPLLQLEERVYAISGIQMASQAADEADENMSQASEQEDEDKESAIDRRQKLLDAWKKKIYTLKSIPTKKTGAIRDCLVAAITAARRAHLGDVVVQLRSILLLHRPCAAGEAKSEALALLERLGGYIPGEDEEEDDGDLDDDANEATQSNVTTDIEVPSLLCGEAMMLSGSLNGDDDADRVDWRDAVKACKTISRFAALVHAFITKSQNILQKMEIDRETLSNALKFWELKESNPKAKTRGSKQKVKGVIRKKGTYDSASEIWAHTKLTDKFVLGKVEGSPWWPARVCEAKDPTVVASLAATSRIIISFVGDQYLHVVSEEDEIRPFYEQKLSDEDMSEYTPDMTKNLEESIKMSKRIRRGRGLTNGRSLRGTFVEEKKSAK